MSEIAHETTYQEWFAVNDLIIAKDFLSTDRPYFQARIFSSDSFWSQQEEVVPGSVGVVLYASGKQTETGHRWHKILVTLADNRTKIGWIEGPGSWEKAR